MSTVETTADSHDEHDDDHHDHGEFIAHHFDSAEQQFDSGKLGIWVFLVTEVLFFSGLFVAYTLYRYHHPEVFVDASQFLDKVLGGINTVVLLFSSLTMAWAVRAAQLGNNNFAGKLILITMVCAAAFLGIKAVEYSHKWDLYILPVSYYNYMEGYHPEAETGGIAGALNISKWLVTLSMLPLLCLALFSAGALFMAATGKRLMAQFMLALAIMMSGYFVGAFAGQTYQNWHEANLAAEEHAGDHGHDDGHAAESATAGPDSTSERPPQIGVFFSIYYCMTGLHAVHVIAGMAALSWLYLRCLKAHFRPDYFGPVDYVGLYWHLVDLIWIYLFPLLYLIN
ncbi:MAG: cytochrome c oxidase subunit 3 family protein [Planctomycetaceae bacterium]|nr:cytochrome c oxidase subunit 3 family protein [Planctomycetaceae bacterium]MCP4463832.1 cytochrome c oxidase subunit 3 family protein [Planctomycetaceae bacterium]